MIAMIRPSVKETARQLIRYGRFAEKQAPNMAVFLAAESCERCINSLAHRYGLDWGYREGSDKWHLAGTTCSRCEDLGRGRFWVCEETGDEEFPYRWHVTDEGKKASARQYEKYCNSRGMTVAEMEACLATQAEPCEEEE